MVFGVYMPLPFSFIFYSYCRYLAWNVFLLLLVVYNDYDEPFSSWWEKASPHSGSPFFLFFFLWSPFVVIDMLYIVLVLFFSFSLWTSFILFIDLSIILLFVLFHQWLRIGEVFDTCLIFSLAFSVTPFVDWSHDSLSHMLWISNSRPNPVWLLLLLSWSWQTSFPSS